MTIQEIRELVQVVTESGIAELEVERGDNRVHIKRSYGVSQEVMVTPAPAAQSAQYAYIPPTAAAIKPSSVVSKVTPSDSDSTRQSPTSV